MTEGQKFDQGKPDWSLVPWEELEEVVKVLTHGKEKYGAQNWKMVPEARDRYFAAAQRHLAAFRRARFDTRSPFDAVDSESKLHHLATLRAASCFSSGTSARSCARKTLPGYSWIDWWRTW